MKICFFIALLIISTNSIAELNKWVDSKGRIHYSDTPPPPDVSATKIKTSSEVKDTSISNNADDSSPSVPESLAEQEAKLKKSQLEKKSAAEKTAKEKAYNDALSANCERVKANLRVLEEGLRLVEVDANGEQTFMSDENRKRKLSENQADINKYCK